MRFTAQSEGGLERPLAQIDGSVDTWHDAVSYDRNTNKMVIDLGQLPREVARIEINLNS